jgi:hypothetical protein
MDCRESVGYFSNHYCGYFRAPTLRRKPNNRRLNLYMTEDIAGKRLYQQQLVHTVYCLVPARCATMGPKFLHAVEPEP